MAFSFGATTTPAFAATSVPSFGGAGTPAFGAQSSPFNFASSTPAFAASQPASTPFGTSLFGQSAFGQQQATTSAFGVQSSPAFGAASAPAFSFANTAGSLFGSSTPALGGGVFSGQSTPASSTTALSLAFAPQQQQQPINYQVLVTKDNKPLVHSTAWDDIHPEGQKYLLELEKQVVQYREESRQLDECQRLKDSRQMKQGLKEDERTVRQLLQTLNSQLRVDNEAVSAFRERVLNLLRETEAGVRAFQRSKKWREAAKASQGQVLPPAVREQLSGAVVLPSVFLRDMVPTLKETVSQYAAMVADLERTLPLSSEPSNKAAGPDVLQALPSALSNLHEFFINVAARLDRVHEQLAEGKEAYLAELAAAGDDSDPFAEADDRDRRRSQEMQRQVANIPAAALVQASASSAQPLALGAATTPTTPAPSALFPGAAAGATPAGPSPFGGTAGGLFGTPGTAAPGGFFGNTAAGPATLARQPSVRKGKNRK